MVFQFGIEKDTDLPKLLNTMDSSIFYLYQEQYGGGVFEGDSGGDEFPTRSNVGSGELNCRLIPCSVCYFSSRYMLYHLCSSSISLIVSLFLLWTLW